MGRTTTVLREGAAAHAGANLVFTGQAMSIQALRARLRADPQSTRGQKSKAHWAPGKRRLD